MPVRISKPLNTFFLDEALNSYLLSFEDITVVPRSAVKNDMIWVVEKDYLRKKSVEVIRYEDDLAFIADGLNKNDRVLITRLDSYVDGMPVREN